MNGPSYILCRLTSMPALPVEEREACIKEHVLPKDPFLGNFPEDRNAYDEITETFLKAYRDRYLGSNSELQVSKVAFNASGLALITCLGKSFIRVFKGSYPAVPVRRC